jgi:hypothetical protein
MESFTICVYQHASKPTQDNQRLFAVGLVFRMQHVSNSRLDLSLQVTPNKFLPYRLACHMMSARRRHIFALMSQCDNWFAFVHRQRTQHSAVPGYNPRGKARVDRNPGSTLAGNHLLYNHKSDAHTLPTMRSVLALQQFMHSYERATWACLQGMCLLFSRFSGAGV